MCSLYSEQSLILGGDPRTDREYNVIFHSWHFAVTSLGQIWDLTTLMLYSFKIWSFRKLYRHKHEGVWSKIIFILYRIVIVTIFYQLSSLILALMYNALSEKPYLEFIRTQLLPALFSILISFCLFLMMEHNTDKYVVFLQFLRRSCLDSVCFCCCRGIVRQQLLEFEKIEIGTRLQICNSNSANSTTPHSPGSPMTPTPRQQTVDTYFSNISKNIVYETGRDNAPSLDTVTVIHNSPRSGPLRPSICPIEEEDLDTIDIDMVEI